MFWLVISVLFDVSFCCSGSLVLGGGEVDIVVVMLRDRNRVISDRRWFFMCVVY